VFSLRLKPNIYINLGECRSSGCKNYWYIFFFSFRQFLFALHPSRSQPRSVSVKILCHVTLGATFISKKNKGRLWLVCSLCWQSLYQTPKKEAQILSQTINTNCTMTRLFASQLDTVTLTAHIYSHTCCYYISHYVSPMPNFNKHSPSG